MTALFDWLKQPRHLQGLLACLLPLWLALLFIWSYGRQTPYADQWHISMEVAVKAEQGTLTFADIVAPYNGHRYLGTHTFTAITTWLSGWDIRWESYSNWALILVNFAISGWFLRRQQPQIAGWGLIAFGWLWFSTYQDMNLLVGFQSSWHYVIVFPLLGIVILYVRPVGWLPLLLAAGLAVASTFSFGNGLVAWPMIGVAAWLRGYKHPIYLAVMLAMALLSAYVYFSNSGISYSADGSNLDSESVIRTASPLAALKFILAFLANPIAFDKFTYAIWIGLLGCVVFGINALYIWRYLDRTHLGIWTALAGHALGSAVIIMFSRIDPDNLSIALYRRYTTASIPLWVAVMALILIVNRDLQGKNSDWRWLYRFNLVAGYVIGFCILWTFIYGLQFIAIRQDHPINYWEDPVYFREDVCILDYPLYRDAGCLEPYRIDGGNIPERILRLAAYRLTIFYGQTAESVLPPTYQTDSPIIIHTPTQWLNVYIRDWMLPGISEAQQLHLAPDNGAFSTQELANPLDHTLAELDEAAIRDFVGASDQLWYIGTPETADAQAAFFEIMTTMGYAPTQLPLQHGRYRQTRFNVYRFQRQPENTTTLYTFGEEQISLQAWSITQGDQTISSRGESRLALTFAPCDEIRLQSWWTSAEIPLQNYSTTLVLVAPAGNNIAQRDASIGDTLLQQWEPDRFYFDERSLTIPCDAPPGAYALQLGFYVGTDSGFVDLAVTDAAGESQGTRALITTVTVQ